MFTCLLWSVKAPLEEVLEALQGGRLVSLCAAPLLLQLALQLRVSHPVTPAPLQLLHCLPLRSQCATNTHAVH